MFLSDISLKRPIAMTVVLLVLALFGFLAWRTAGVDLVPLVDVPYVTVTVVYPGATPEEIETAVVRKIEDAVSQVDGLKHMTATCANNFCQVMLEFHLDRDVDTVATDVREKIDLIVNDLPSGAEKPNVAKFDVNATPVVTMALTSSSAKTVENGDLYDYADNRLSSRFSSLPGVASVELIGGEKREVVVEVDRSRLAAKGLTLAEVVGKVGKGNIKIPSGEIDEAGRSAALTFDAEAKEPSELGAIELGRPGGAKVYLRDVAKFHFGTKRAESLAYFNGEPAVVLKITKKGEANAAKVVDLVRRAAEKAKAELPAGMSLNWVRDDGAYVHATVRGGFDSIWQGILLTGAILVLFLSEWSSALVAFVSIPVTIIIALIVFPFFDCTFNLVTMSAVGISSGILVANSIVVLENIAARFQRGGDGGVKATVAKAAGQVAVAVCASALTNIVVFLPIATMKTLAGRFFVPFAIVIAAATFASLFVSFTLTPILSSMFAGRGAGVNRTLSFVLAPWNACYNAAARFYRATLFPALRHPVLLIAAVAVLSAAGFAYLVPRLQLDFIPTMDKGEMTVRLEYPADTALEKTAERTLALARKIGSLKDSAGEALAQSVTISVGKTQGILGAVSQGAYLAEIAVKLKDMTARRETIQDVAERLRDVCREEPDVIWSALVPLVIGGSAQSAEFRILGDDFDTLNAVGLATAREAAADPSCADVSHSIRIGRPETRLYPKRAVLNDLGVTPDLLGTSLRASFAGLKCSRFTKGDRSYDVRVRFAEEDGFSQVDALNFPGVDGVPFALDSVARKERVMKPVQIVRSMKRRAVTVYANNARGYGLGTTLGVLRAAAGKHLPPGYETTVGGTAEYMDETFGEFALVTSVAIILTYLLLAAIMESWTMPFVVLFTVPFAYLGMFAALWVTHTTFTVFGLLAGIMLVGVVVNAAILIVDERTMLLGRGIAPRAATLKASAAKFRPVLMSSAASLFGMLPMALGSGLGSELRAAIGIGSVGGILLSAVVSLYLIPALTSLVRR
ncbi:MAG: efflux RND transporter permease subunit [Kiritimatiellae bacterium]|nr:efflux RND transporter permease subunit [Kiritimatiellia bacterium]